MATTTESRGSRGFDWKESADLWAELGRVERAKAQGRYVVDVDVSGPPGAGPRTGAGCPLHQEVAEGQAHEAQMRELLRLYREGDVKPEEVELGSLPADALRTEQALYELLELRFGLLLADGTREPMMLATSELVAEGIVHTKSGASRMLHRFEDWGLIHCVGEMRPLGRKGNGTRLFLPGRP